MKTELIESLDFTEEDYNEKIAGEKLRRSRRNDIIKKCRRKKQNRSGRTNTEKSGCSAEKISKHP